MTAATKVSFTYTNKTIGMPDQTFIDPQYNRPAECVLRNSLRMRDRRQGKQVLNFLKKKPSVKIISITEGKELLIDYYADPTFRRMLYFSVCEKHLKKLKCEDRANLSRVLMPSWELITFLEYAPELFIDDAVFEGFHFPVDTEMLDEKESDEIAQESLMLASAVTNKLMEELQTDVMAHDRKELLGYTVLACATVIGAEVFNKAVALVPELFDMYSSIRNLKHNQQLAIDVKESLGQSIAEVTQFNNEAEFLDAIEAKVAECRAESDNAARVHELSLLASNFTSWFDTHPKSSVEELFLTWVTCLFSMGKRAKLPLYTTDNEDPAIWDIFQQVYVESFQGEAGDNATDNTLVEQFEDIQKALQKLLVSIRAIESQLSISQNKLSDMNSSSANSVLAQRKKDRALLNLEMTVSSRRSELLDAQDKAALSLLPSNASLEIFDQESMENDKFKVEMGFASEGLICALREFGSWAAEHGVNFEPKLDDKDNGNITLPSSSPISGEPDAENTLVIEVPTTDNTSLENEGMDNINAEVEKVSSFRGVSKTAELEGKVETPRSIDVEPAPADAVDGGASDNGEAKGKSKSVDLIKPEDIELVKEPLNWCELALACKADLDRDVFIPGDRVNEALATFILNDQVEVATDFAFTLSDNQLSKGHLPYQLLKAAYYGMNTWNDRACFNKSRRLLNAINTGDLDVWSEQRSSDMAPFLLFVACFQPVIFGGNASTAVTLLCDIPDNFFNKSIHILIKEAIELANRGESVTLKSLKAGGKTNVRPIEFDLTGLDHWSQKIRQSRRGYAPILKAQTYLLESGIFYEIESILKANDRQKTAIVTQFVTRFDDIEASTLLLNETLDQINCHVLDGISRLGRQRFHHKVSEFVEIARDWLASVQHAQGSHAEQYCTRFSTRLKQAIGFYDSVVKEKSSSLSRQAGNHLLAQQLKRIHAAISAGESHWNYSRTKSWYYHPQMLMRIDSDGQEPTAHLNWHLSQLEKPLNVQNSLEKAIDVQNIQLAELLRMNLLDAGIKDVPEVQQHFLTLKRELISRCRQLDGQLENALLAALIDASQAESYTAGLGDMQEALDQLISVDSVEEIKSYLDELENTLSKLTASTKRDLELRYESLLTQVQSNVGEDAVPKSWRRNMQDALVSDNLSVAIEMLDELERSAIEAEPIKLAETNEVKNVEVLQSFIQAEEKIIGGIQRAENRNELCHFITEGGKAFGLTYKSSQSHLRHAIEILESWKISGKPKKSFDKDSFDKIVALLSMMGIVPHNTHFNGILKKSLNYQVAIGFSSIVMQVDSSPSTRPFTLFGKSLGVHNLPIIVAYSSWTAEQLREVMEAHHIHDAAILISSVSLTLEQRNNFSQFCKKRRKTILHFDLPMAIFLSSQEQEGAENFAVRNFLWLSAPYTYFNPYSGTDASKPPLREMRYGREFEIDSLLKMDNGSAIVFGGRQLGKSTIMQEVQARFHRPIRRDYAFYEMLDKDLFGRINVSQQDLIRAELKIWKYLYSWLNRFELISDPSQNLEIDAIKNAVKQALIDNKDSRFIAIFDEIDPILHVDSAHDFSIFRGIRNLIQIPEINGRFKVIIGGLANVKRFENSPNYPLTQLGGSIQVSIMPAQQALHLIIEPLRAAGYAFDSAQVANRILATTNRHPGLIQIFCHELINHLANNKQQNVGERIILDEDVVNVSRKSTVMELIRNRFDMTLNLDKRYQVIIYSIINDGRGSQPFTPRYAKSLAECWLPEAFSQLSDKQFESFLVELVGLGVLRQVSKGSYALRNTNVLRLLTDGHGEDAATKLGTAIKDYINYDPLDRHAYDPNKHPAPMPITCRDERDILGAVENTDELSPLRKLNMRSLTTSIVVGSEALGINQLENTLPSLYAEEKETHIHCYTAHSVTTDQYSDPAAFNKRLLIPLVTKRANEAPQMAFITIGQNTTLENLLGMLDAAHGLTEQFQELPNPVRIVFLMGPRAYWQWLCRPDLTRERESLQPFIKLSPWANDAIRALLERLGMNDSTNATEDVSKMTEGWYFSLEILTQVSRGHPDWKELSQFSNNFVSLTELKRPTVGKFLEKTGLIAHSEALSILIEVYKEYGTSPFGREEVELYAEDVGAGVIDSDKAKAFIKWFSGTNLVFQSRKHGSGEQQFQLKEAISHALKIWIADE